ncbi:peptidase M20 [Platysternon megacephalum]|uniref:Peptidase M20 n=1 Tax=Platysternon megacephalum TaxID=55544 RepID=A0A4D9DCI9_9SAUR|nr:peptidase M20 [Platysternon megacephalum]
MGSGVAQVAALAGHEVHLVDAREGAAAEAIARLQATLHKLAAKGKFTAQQASDAASRLHVGASVAALPDCQLVVEAIVENLDVKRQVFAELAASQPSTTVLASNTSSLDISAIAKGLAHPERVIGLHFFNPAAIMKLVEVVHGDSSDHALCDAIAKLVTSWGKTPVRCASTPGFIVNRVARPYYGEAQRLVQSGVCDAATVDFCLTQAGFAMGPMALTDLIGHDVNYRVGESVWEQTDRDPRYEPTACQKALVDAGHFGRKTGQGFFRYVDGVAVDATPNEALAHQLMSGPVVTHPVARTLAMLVNEAVDVVHRGEATAADVDTAMRLGTNYPRGPIAWGAEIGFDVVEQQLRELDAAFPGGRYRPSPALAEAHAWALPA